jgi:hypothetical protein
VYDVPRFAPGSVVVSTSSGLGKHSEAEVAPLPAVVSPAGHAVSVLEPEVLT